VTAAKRRDVVFYTPTAAPLLAAGGPAPAGGAENQILMLARELARRGYAVGIVAFGDVELVSELDGVDVIVHHRSRTRLPVLRTLAFYRDAFATIRANPASVLVQRAAGIHTAVVAVSARALRCRFVFASASLHDFDLREWELTRWIRAAFAVAVRLADELVVQTEEQAQLCRQHVGREPHVIKSIAEPVPAGVLRPEAFLWIGAVYAHKQPLEFAALARALPQARFRMVVTPWGEPDLELAAALARAAGELPNLELLEPRPRAELASLFEQAVAIVSTSKSEGMPNVFLEAWSHGVPALALAHDPDGLLERQGLGSCGHGSASRLATLANSLWESRDDGDAQAARCRAYVARHHSLERVADRWLQVLGLS
jgi:glycosyltransferase involved in cell wall biosynthesis